MKKALVLAVIAFISTSVFAQTKWTVDAVHSSVKFTVTHLVISEVEGSFKKFDGSITAAKPDFTDASINFTVDVNSISTDNDMRDKHLKSDDFFNAEKFPAMTFKSTGFKKLTANKYALSGNLTIRDVTKPVVFNVVYGGTVKDGYGNTKAGFKATAAINRFDYNLKWNALTEAGGATVGKDINMEIRLEFAQAK
ncbi:YceI family protein [Limnovirga soli]|jgi:polyisoprenoid-binding protein YceI|uniref:Polyisoprenoid-binding protein n=1 Tax=Limnovirga soli TaxID=2656915 RepID=A0A8J8FDU1_9BACT|nr:YceI family protein [Limnovirga soli]NNV56220.1 polyisoprenoid-binding protein [Limnovirga soli]